jgi:polyisoprenoid-binding protein YceI
MPMSIRRLPLLLMLLIALLGAGCGLLSEPQGASGPLEAIPLELETPEDTNTRVAPTNAPVVVDESDEEAEAYPPPAVEPDAAAPAAAYPAYPDPQAVPQADDGSAAPGALRVYRIVQDASEVTFQLDEDLRGQRTTVLGTTNQVAGELAFNLADLSTAQAGIIQINARTLLTDNSFRNRAIHNEILESGAYEFITFSPTAINELPASAQVGEEVRFTIDGELTIRDITRPVTFDVVTVAQSETEVTGVATATVQRADFGLVIPQVPQVANVDEEVALTINFTARAS